jgi:glycerophosphoryl diester phosphodiesterase
MKTMKKSLLSLAVLALAACKTPQPTAQTAPVAAFDEEAHRGGRGLYPENTIPAMLHAIDLDVTTLEMDLVISGDRKVVVSHDVYFNENITTTPEGQTLKKGEGAKRLIYLMPYDSVRKYDVGLKPHPDYPRQKKLAVSKPLLAELIEAAEAHARTKGKVMEYNIEIKSKPENDGKKHPPVEEFVDLAMAVIREKGIASRTILQSFDPRALQVVHRKYPDVRTSLLMEASDKRSLAEQLKELGYTPPVYSPNYALVTLELMKQCRALGMKVIPWTVNNLEEMKRLKALGVDGIISDYPDLFAQLR